MGKHKRTPNSGQRGSDRTEAQKRFLRKHYAEQAELDQDDQWSTKGNTRLSYYADIQAASTEPRTDESADRNTRTDDNGPDRDGFPF